MWSTATQRVPLEPEHHDGRCFDGRRVTPHGSHSQKSSRTGTGASTANICRQRQHRRWASSVDAGASWSQAWSEASWSVVACARHRRAGRRARRRWRAWRTRSGCRRCRAGRRGDRRGGASRRSRRRSARSRPGRRAAGRSAVRVVWPMTMLGSSRSRRSAPIEYVRIAPTPCVSTSQPSSSSIGDPQLPSWTELHVWSTTSSGVAVGQRRRSSDDRERVALAVAPRQGVVAATDASREQGEALVGRGGAEQRE